MKKAVILLVIAMTALATSAIGLDRLALWPVVQACVADFKLTGAPFPCLEVDLSNGDERGYVVLRSPLLNDLIVAPTRQIIGIEDPFLLSAGATNYFNAAWRARSFLKAADGGAPERDEIALVANSAAVRTQDQLHIHVVYLICLPSACSQRLPRTSRSANGRGSAPWFPVRYSGGCASGELIFRTSSRFGSLSKPLPARSYPQATWRSRPLAFASKATTNS